MNELPSVVNFQAAMMGSFEHHRTSGRGVDRRNDNRVSEITKGRLAKSVGEKAAQRFHCVLGSQPRRQPSRSRSRKYFFTVLYDQVKKEGGRALKSKSERQDAANRCSAQEIESLSDRHTELLFHDLENPSCVDTSDSAP